MISLIELKVFGTIFGILDIILVLWLYKIYIELKEEQTLGELVK